MFMYLKILWPLRSCIFWSATTMLLGPQEDGGWTGLVTAGVRNEKTKIHV